MHQDSPRSVRLNQLDEKFASLNTMGSDYIKQWIERKGKQYCHKHWNAVISDHILASGFEA